MQADLPQAVIPEKLFETLTEVVGRDGLSLRIQADVVLRRRSFLPIAVSFFLLQNDGDLLRHGERAAAGFLLHGVPPYGDLSAAHLLINPGMLDLDGAHGKINAPPLNPQHLAAAQAVKQAQHHGQPEPVAP